MRERATCLNRVIHERPFKSLADKTPPPIGKIWEFDVLSYRVPSRGKNYIGSIRFVDKSEARYKVLFGIRNYSEDEIETRKNMHRARVRPKHGEIHQYVRDAHPTHKSYLELWL